MIYFDIDSLRPDHLGCYGYQRPLSIKWQLKGADLPATIVLTRLVCRPGMG